MKYFNLNNHGQMLKKADYCRPVINTILLDNEISLSMESDNPMDGPDEIPMQSNYDSDFDNFL